MYKSLRFSFLFLILITSVKAQTKATEAKAAYLLAEESYAKSDYKSALNYLDEAKKNLGAANSKILFLQIQIQMELFKTDRSYLNRTLQSIAEFEAAPDYKDFNEEKSLEVSKIKLQLKNELKNDEQLKEKAAAKKVNALKVFADFVQDNKPINIPLTELQARYQQYPLLANKLKDIKDEKYNAVMHYPAKLKLLQWPNFRVLVNDGFFKFYNVLGVYAIFTKNDIVKGYASLELERDEGNGGTYANATTEFENVLKNYTELFGMKPKRVERPGKGYYQTEDYVWESDEKTITLEHTYGPTFRAVPWHVSVSLCVIYKQS